MSAAAAFYVFQHRPFSVIRIVAALAFVVESSLPLWVSGYGERRRRYLPALRSLGFGLLLIASLQRGSAPFSIGFGILFIRSAYIAFREFSRGSP